MKILCLKAENFKRLHAVEITPKGNVIKITGKNAEGKSSILDAIWCACGGGDVLPEKPIRDGEENAKIELDLGDIKVKRRFTQKSSTLTVENADGAIFRSPQKVLDELIGKLSFDPMHFMHMKEKDQFVTLAEHAGVDFTELDQQRKELFDDRTIVNRECKSKKAEVEAAELVYDTEAPDEEVSIADLVVQLNKGNQVNLSIDQINDDIGRYGGEIDRTNEEIGQLQAKINERVEWIEKLNSKVKDAESQLQTLKRVDVSVIQMQINTAEEINTAVRAKKHYLKLVSELEVMRNNSAALTNNIETIDAKREKIIQDSNLPVAGLSFGEDVVLYNGIPISQVSSAEQLRISTAVAMAMNPKLKVIRVQDGSLLDSYSMKVLEDMANEKDFQFWIEQVDESGRVGVVIEDGHVKSDNQ